MEVCELVMDFVHADRNLNDEDPETQQTLSSCALVSRAWSIRARKHLYTHISIKYDTIISLDKTLKGVCHLISYMTELSIEKQSEIRPISSFVIRHKPVNLATLSITEFDLNQEH